MVLSTPAAAPPRGRLPELDGLRGVFLLLMTLGHLRLASDVLQKLHPGNVSFVDAAYGFVFLSGLVAGLVYGRMALREGLPAMRRRVRRRAAALLVYAAALVAALILAAQLFPPAAAAWSDLLGPVAGRDPRAWIAGLLLIQHVDYADILPQYVFYLLLTPLVLAAALRRRLAVALAASALLWLAVQFGAAAPAFAVLEGVLRLFGPDLYPPRVFNPLAWQLLFVWGCGLGALTARDRGGWRARARLDSRPLLWLVLGVLTLIGAFRLAEHAPAFAVVEARSLQPALEHLVSKPRLGVLSVVNVAALAWLTAWLLLVAVHSSHRLTRRCGRAVRVLLNQPLLRLLGRHSLLVYVWHVGLIYAVEALLPRADRVSEPLRSADVLVVMALLAAPAVLAEARLRRLRAPRVAPAKAVS